MAKNQNFGLPIIQDENIILRLKTAFEDFQSWAMIGSGREKSGYYISKEKLLAMIKDNADSDGFKICLGIKEDLDESDQIVNRSIEIIITAIKFEETTTEENPYAHTSQTVYSSIPTVVIEPPVLQCPPLRCK
jgi:hypothetical protein